MKRCVWTWFAMMGIVVLLLGSFPGTGARAQASAASNFFNDLVQSGADPSVYHHTDGYYYSSHTTGDSVKLWRHRSLTGMDAGESITLWSGCCNVWAPEVTYINNTWNIYFAKDDGSGTNHSMYVLSNPNADPFTGTWTLTRIYDPANDQWAIDGTVLNNNGQLYFIWSGWDNPNDHNQNLYIAKMDSPTHLSSSRVKIAYPQYAWETNTAPQNLINEGPETIIHNGVISLVYSGSGSWTDTYALGLITASTGSDLLNPASWTKRSTPIFQSANGLYGPGHHSFTKSPDGTQDWIVYHTARWQGSGWTRTIRAQPFSWNADNTPNLGAPVPPNTPIALPSGELPHDRYEAENATLGGGARIITQSGSSGGAKVGYIDTTSDYVQFTVNAPAAGYYTLVGRTDNGTSGQSWAVLDLSVNGGAATAFNVAYSGWDNWTNATAKIHLNAGSNTIRFTHNTNYAEVDCIDIFSDTPVVSGGVYKLLNPHSGLMLDVAGGGTTDGTNVQVWTDNGLKPQEWKIEAVGNGDYKLVNTNSGKVLDVNNSGTADGTNVQIWTDHGGANQIWRFADDGGDQFKLINPNSGKALDVAGAGTSPGTNVQIWDPNSSGAQEWELIRKY